MPPPLTHAHALMYFIRTDFVRRVCNERITLTRYLFFFVLVALTCVHDGSARENLISLCPLATMPGSCLTVTKYEVILYTYVLFLHTLLRALKVRGCVQKFPD
jgi:hypothetical protein